MKILVLSRYERLGASSRIRMLQYIPYLEDHGVRITVSALFTNNYLRFYYDKGRKSFREIIKSYLVRVSELVKAGGYGLLWVEKEFFPFLPSWGETLLRLFGVPYVVDYDDAVFHNYDIHSNSMIRAVLGRKTDAVMRNAAMVIVGNDYIADRAGRAGAKRVEYLPSVIDLNRYHMASPPVEKRSFTIGWIGSPSATQYLNVAVPALAEICNDGNGRVVLIGAGSVALPGVPCEVRSWSEDTEVADIQKFDVGIMPLPDTPWERGKCGFKLIQYMACGLPVVASPVGVNSKIVEHGRNGFLATTKDEWSHALRTLRDSLDLRCSQGAAGRRKVEQKYCLQVTAPRLHDLLKSAAK
jgi:glycosyltransferase involved in cell wall biosynthesis